jgi:hypothetical protein
MLGNDATKRLANHALDTVQAVLLKDGIQLCGDVLEGVVLFLHAIGLQGDMEQDNIVVWRQIWDNIYVQTPKICS